MADPQQLQQQVEQLNIELNRTLQQIENLGSYLDKSVRKQFIGITEDVRKLGDGLLKSKNITKDLTELTKKQNELNKKNVSISIEKKIAEDRLNAASTKYNNDKSAANRLELIRSKQALRSYTLQLKINEALEDEIRKLISAAEQLKQQNSLSRILQDSLEKNLGISLDQVKSMFTLAGLMKIIIDAAFRFNKVSVETGKNLGYGADQADRVTSNLTTMARNSSNLNFTLANAAEAMNGLNASTGLVAEYSADTLETQIMLTKQFGLTEEEAAGIYKFSVLTGQAASKVNDEMIGAFVAARNSLKVGANFKQVMGEAAKVSGQLAANLGYNPDRIVRAIVAMKAFGTTLEQTKNQGEALLNFESSIENELQAELITGQKLNLEKARAAALAGDQVALAQELSNQGMTLEKFQNMNVIAQQSYAQALGLSADQLSDQLQKQKLAQESGKSLAELTKEEAIEAEKRQNIQDKFNAAILKLQDFIGGLVAGPFGTLLDVLAQALDIVNLIIAPFKLIYDLTSYIGNAIGGLIGKLGVVGKILKGLAGIAIVYAAYKAYASLAALPIIGVGLGASAAAAITAAGFGLLNTQKFAKGGIITSEINNATVGEAGPEAIIPLNSPKADKMLGGGMDLTPMIAAINEVRNAVNNLASKSSDVILDGQKVGKQLGTVKALGTSQVQNSYKLA